MYNIYMPTNRITKRTKSRRKRMLNTEGALKMKNRVTGPKGPKKRSEQGDADISTFEQLFGIPEGPTKIMLGMLGTPEIKILERVTVGLERSLNYVMDDLVRDDAVFKEFWEKRELDEYYYSLPMYIGVPGDDSRRERILYKIKKINVKPEGPRHRQDVGQLARQIGCLNSIKYKDKEMRIYDFPYPVPTIEEPAELDIEWERAIKARWGGEEDYNQAAYEAADATYTTIEEHIAKKETYKIEDRYMNILYDERGEIIGNEEFRKHIMKEKLSWCYLDEQKRWVREVFFMDHNTTNPIKHVELETMYDMFKGMVMNSYECCDRLCKRVKDSFQGSCSIMGGRRKRTRRRRKKNRKKRTKKKARRKRRRRSSKRRRRRKR